jgi:hypothetical protein
MKKLSVLLAALFIMVFFTSTLAVSAGPYDKYLTAADIASVSGLKGVKLIPKNPSIGAGGDLNFAINATQLVVMVQVVDKSNYAGYKQLCFKAVVKGLGDQAMEGAAMPGGASNQVVFTKGNKCVALTAFGDPNDPGKNMLTVEQLIKLAKIIVTRM